MKYMTLSPYSHMFRNSFPLRIHFCHYVALLFAENIKILNIMNFLHIYAVDNELCYRHGV